MKDRVILFPEENRKLKYFKNDETYPRLKDTENTQDTMTTHPRQRRSNKRVAPRRRSGLKRRNYRYNRNNIR